MINLSSTTPANNYIVRADQAQIEISYLNTNIGAFHISQKTNPPIAKTSHVVIGMVIIFQKTLRCLIKLNATYEPHIGVFRMISISSDILKDSIAIKVIGICFDSIKQGRV